MLLKNQKPDIYHILVTLQIGKLMPVICLSVGSSSIPYFTLCCFRVAAAYSALYNPCIFFLLSQIKSSYNVIRNSRTYV